MKSAAKTAVVERIKDLPEGYMVTYDMITRWGLEAGLDVRPGSTGEIASDLYRALLDTFFFSKCLLESVSLGFLLCFDLYIRENSSPKLK